MALASLYQTIGAALLAWLPLSSAIASSAADRSDGAPTEAEATDARAIARRAENSLRADRSFMSARVTVRSPRGTTERIFEFECWNDRVERRSFLRVVAPDSVAGTALLDLPPNLWSYEPELERAQWIRASARWESWLGSDFAIGDLIDPVSDVEDHEVELLRIEEPSDGGAGTHLYVLQYTPTPAAHAGPRTRVAWIEVETGVPVRQDFYGVGGERLRTILYSEFRSVAGRRVPHRWKAITVGEKGRESVLEIRDLRFEAAFDDAIFTTENLAPAADVERGE